LVRGWGRNMAPLILNLGTRRRWVINFTLLPLCSWEWASVILATCHHDLVFKPNSCINLDKETKLWCPMRGSGLSINNPSLWQKTEPLQINELYKYRNYRTHVILCLIHSCRNVWEEPVWRNRYCHCGIDDREIVVWFPTEARGFSPHLSPETGPGAHPLSCLLVTMSGFFSRQAAVASLEHLNLMSVGPCIIVITEE